MDKVSVDREVAALHRKIWEQRVHISGSKDPSPLSLIDPRLVTTHVLGLEYEVRESIDGDGSRAAGAPAGGFLDRARGIICVSARFSDAIQRFTAAHEIGHYVLHAWVGDKTVHRDIPLGGSVAPVRSALELEADHFAASLLMPRKLVKRAFVARFGTDTLRADDETTNFHLSIGGSKGFFESRRDSLTFASAAARAESFAGNRFDSLAACFRVSVRAMAIRLDELGLMRDAAGVLRESSDALS